MFEFLNTRMPFIQEGAILNFLSAPGYLSGISQGDLYEKDYEWDFLKDPIITPTIIHEWLYLDELIAKNVIGTGEKILSVGGGGSSRTHLYMSTTTKNLIIVNPGKWDLSNYPDSFKNTTIIKIRALAEKLPILDAAIDGVEIPGTLDHVLDPKRSMLEVFRVLKPGAKIAITLGNNESWYRSLLQAMKINFNDNHVHSHNTHFTPKDIENLMKTTGYTKIHTIGTAYLKLPKIMERRIRGSKSLACHRFISNKFLAMFFSPYRGGMYCTIGEKPKSTLSNV